MTTGKTALGHIKVLDLTRVVAGPWATQILADMGAAVTKVERPVVGDDLRSWGPPFLEDQEGNETNASAFFLSTNRGKRSVTIDISTKAGQEIIRELAREADVLVENYKVGTLARYGLDFESLAEINPRLVYCSVTGFGQTGPYSPLPGYDFVFQGMGGIMSMTGLPEGQPGGGPLKTGLPISDLVTGLYASTAILGALESRNVSGKGQHIDIALLDCLISVTGCQFMTYFLSGKLPQRMGNEHLTMVPYQAFKCREGDIIVAVGNDGQFVSFCQVIGMPELSSDPQFKTSPQRSRNRAALIPMISERMLTKPSDEWIALLEAANVPCGPIYNAQQVFEDPHVQHRQMKISLPHGVGVDTPAVANPIRFSDTQIVYGKAAPVLGDSTDKVLGEIGLTATQIDALRQKGII